MKAIVFLSSLYTGGAEFSTLSLYGWLVKRGHSIKLVCYKEATPSYDISKFGLEEVYYLKGGSFWKRLRDFQHLIMDFKPQVVHSVLFEANVLARCARMSQRKFVHIESLVNEMYSPNRLTDPQITRIKLLYYRILDFVTQYFGVDHFHANGNAVAKHYTNQLGINPKRISIIPRGRASNEYLSDRESRQAIRVQLKSKEKILLINVARHEYQKGQDVLLDAINLLKDEGLNFQLILAGREGKLTQVIRTKIKDYDLEEMVVVLGHREDISSLLAAADIFVFPSRFEGLPGALIEAEAAGLPIICTDIANNHEVAEQGRNAFFFPVDDSHKLADCIRTLIMEKKLREQFGTESLIIFNHRFSLEEVHIKMESLLLQLINGQNK